MGTGAITAYFDVAQITLYAFWIFFAGLIYYLHREDKREGYPLDSERSTQIRVQGFPPIPQPKTYLLRDGRKVLAPNFRAGGDAGAGEPAATHLGAGLEPVGDPLSAGVGPGAYSDRADLPDTTLEGQLRIAPLRVINDFQIAGEDPDPRGLPVIGADGVVGGTVTDLWLDRAEVIFRYLEVEVPGQARHVLLPVNFSRIGARQVRVRALLGHQIAQVPVTRNPDAVTLLEEDRITAYYGAGTLYATPARREPLL